MLETSGNVHAPVVDVGVLILSPLNKNYFVDFQNYKLSLCTGSAFQRKISFLFII
jgi:hypothetical protein